MRDRLAGRSVLAHRRLGVPRQGRAGGAAAPRRRDRAAGRAAQGGLRRRRPPPPARRGPRRRALREPRRRPESGRSPATSARTARRAASELAGIDTVIHCAATVSFEEPLDQALALNAFGPVRLLERLESAGSRPHFVHVSTAYVADRQSGEVAEDGLPHHAVTDLDPERMLDEARGWREAAERESRAEPQASRFAKAARRDASMREGLDPRRARRGAARPLAPRAALATRPAAGDGGGLARHIRAQQGARRTPAERTLGEDDDRPADDHRVGAAATPARAGSRGSRSPTR